MSDTNPPETPAAEAKPTEPVPAEAQPSTPAPAEAKPEEPKAPEMIQEPRFWKKDGWTARVIKNEDDDGWAVEMTREGDPEPALVGPWTMGRDKKNPKPLDQSAFTVLIKTASEVIRRTEQQKRALLHKSVAVNDSEGLRIRVDLDIVPDEDDPHAFLTAWDEAGEQLGKAKVPPNFKLSPASATKWVNGGYRDL
jgi:hypothetical protein